MGSFAGEPLYHASLDRDEYRALLNANGFDVVAHVAEDPTCGRRTVWLAGWLTFGNVVLGESLRCAMRRTFLTPAPIGCWTHARGAASTKCASARKTWLADPAVAGIQVSPMRTVERIEVTNAATA